MGAVSEDVRHCFIMSFMKHTRHFLNKLHPPVTPLFPSDTSVSETSWVSIRVASANKVTMDPNIKFLEKTKQNKLFCCEILAGYLCFDRCN